MDYEGIVHATKLSFETTSNLLRKAGMKQAADENDKALSQVLNLVSEPELLTPKEASTEPKLLKSSEPRTCETCGGKLADCGPGKACEHWTSRSPQSADVETVRDALVQARAWTESMTVEYKCGKALAALDRIAGKEE